MIQKMPISGFKWSNKTWSREGIINYNPDGDLGHFLEVDISIPQELHDKFNCYPIMPEPLDITEELASPMSLQIRQKRYGGSNPEKQKDLKFSSIKLAPNLFPKQKYICHIRNLQFYLKQGAKLNNVHRVLTFKQVITLNLLIVKLEF